MKKLVHFETLGCKLNQVETEGIAKKFFDNSYECSMIPVTAKTSVDEQVVVCVLNTCAVTTKAEQKCRRVIRLLLLKFPNAVICVTGCYAQLAQKEILSIDERVCVLEGQMKGFMVNIPSLIDENKNLCAKDLALTIQQKIQSLKNIKKADEIYHPFTLETSTFFNHSRASIKIQDGCNSSCTYCAIRLARGKSVSLDANEVLNRVKKLEDEGQSEVVITTVNIAQYASEWNGKTICFKGLLKILLENTSKIYFRISSLYPEIVDEEFVQVISDKRVRPHFHISIQSGSDDILQKMNRPYKVEKVYSAVKLLKKAKKSPFLACDIITGFPGEAEKDFALTMKMLEELDFTFVHAFPFSARPGTVAFKMRPMVPNSISNERVKCLEKFNSIHKKKYIESFIGQKLSAVCETVHRKKILDDKIVLHAVSDNFIHCQLLFDKNDKNIPLPKTHVQVKIIRLLEKQEITGESEVFAILC